MFLFTRDGNLQNMDLMYAFFLSVAVLFVNFLIGNRVTMGVECLLPDASRGLKNFLDIGIPALLCAAAAGLLFRLIGKKNIVLKTYILLVLITLIFIIAMAVMYDRETLGILLPSVTGIFLVPALTSLAAVILLYRSWAAKNPDPIREEERELEERSKQG